MPHSQREKACKIQIRLLRNLSPVKDTVSDKKRGLDKLYKSGSSKFFEGIAKASKAKLE